MSFFLYSEKPNFFEENTFDSLESIYQFDLWIAKGDPYDLSQKLKGILLANNFKYIETQGYTKRKKIIQHLAFKFLYLNDNLGY